LTGPKHVYTLFGVPASGLPVASICSCVQLRRAARAVTQVFDGVMQPSGLGIAQFSVLRTISRREGMKIKELAARLSLDPTTLTRNLKILEKRGYVKLASGADQRSRAVNLTASGRAAMRGAVRLWESGQKKIRGRVGARRMDEFLSVLAELQAMR
jgi:DNA-binding MarR family transcriptional regulator